MATVPGNATAVLISNEEFEWRVLHASRISHPALRITSSVLFGLALITFQGRICIRICTRRKLHLDDYVLSFAVISLTVATAIALENSYLFYLIGATYQSPELISSPAIVPWLDDLHPANSRKILDLFSVSFWTALYCVKFCYFAFFRPLVRHSSRLRVYYWGCAIFSVAGYAATLGECFHFHRKRRYDGVGGNGNGNGSEDQYIALVRFTIVTGLLDIVSDLTIISIPLLLIRHARLKRTAKYGIASFLCLSVFMAICSICRSSGFATSSGDKRISDTFWVFFWLEVEACVAVIMASVTVFRTLLIAKHSTNHLVIPTPYFVRKWESRSSKSVSAHRKPSERGSGDPKTGEVPGMPAAAFLGIRSFVGRRASNTNGDSGLDSFEGDYHVYVRGGHV